MPVVIKDYLKYDIKPKEKIMLNACYRFKKYNILPLSGGLFDQPKLFWSVLNKVEETINYYEKLNQDLNNGKK